MNKAQKSLNFRYYPIIAFLYELGARLFYSHIPDMSIAWLMDDWLNWTTLYWINLSNFLCYRIRSKILFQPWDISFWLMTHQSVCIHVNFHLFSRQFCLVNKILTASALRKFISEPTMLIAGWWCITQSFYLVIMIVPAGFWMAPCKKLELS